MILLVLSTVSLMLLSRESKNEIHYCQVAPFMEKLLSCIFLQYRSFAMESTDI